MDKANKIIEDLQAIFDIEDLQLSSTGKEEKRRVIREILALGEMARKSEILQAYEKALFNDDQRNADKFAELLIERG